MADNTTKKSARESILLEETRAVIESQRSIIGDIDDKAMHTVRITVILVGVIVAVGRIAGTSLFNTSLLAIGVTFLLVSLIGGVLTYDESNLFLGPNPEYVEELSSVIDDDNYAWKKDLISEFGDWIEENHEDIEWNGELLYYTNLSLVIGVTFAVLSVAF